MKRLIIGIAALALFGAAMAQPFVYGPEYAATVKYGGTYMEDTFSDFTTLNPVLISNATESAVAGLWGGPGFVYRDWLGTRSFRDADGNWNLGWAASVEELVPHQDFIVTVKQGWYWSDGVEITIDDVIAARTIIGDPDVGSNSYVCSHIGGEPIAFEKLSDYSIRITLPQPFVNSLAVKDCGTLPAHIFMPAYEAEGAAGVQALWGIDTPPSELVSGGPYILTEVRTGERLVFERNPRYGDFVQAADGSGLPGPDRWVVEISQDANAILARVVTGQSSAYWPDTADRLRAVIDAVNSGTIQGRVYPNIAPSTAQDFMTYMHNNPDQCKAGMFSNQIFRQAISRMIDRDALVQGAVGGLGFPAKGWTSAAAAPFDGSTVEHIEFDPELALEMLASIGFTATGSDGVLFNPATGCRVAFDLNFNSGNNRRAQLALIISQTAAEYGVAINPREVSVEIWGDAIDGLVDYDAQIWGLAGGDMDNPHAYNVFGLAQSLNAWNKSDQPQSWEILMDSLSTRMSTMLDLDERVAVFNERAELMAEYLPVTPLINQAFHFYENAGNVWPVEHLDPNSIQSPYRPGGFRDALTVP